MMAMAILVSSTLSTHSLLHPHWPPCHSSFKPGFPQSRSLHFLVPLPGNFPSTYLHGLLFHGLFFCLFVYICFLKCCLKLSSLTTLFVIAAIALCHAPLLNILLHCYSSLIDLHSPNASYYPHVAI